MTPSGFPRAWRVDDPFLPGSLGGRLPPAAPRRIPLDAASGRASVGLRFRRSLGPRTGPSSRQRARRLESRLVRQAACTPSVTSRKSLASQFVPRTTVEVSGSSEHASSAPSSAVTVMRPRFLHKSTFPLIIHSGSRLSSVRPDRFTLSHKTFFRPGANEVHKATVVCTEFLRSVSVNVFICCTGSFFNPARCLCLSVGLYCTKQ